LQKSLLDDASESATKIVQEENNKLQKDLQNSNDAVQKI
jgi:vacuolar-type H+-ATPase subunit E/Vma4